MHQYRHMTTTQTTRLSDYTVSTLGTWAYKDARITASYNDEATVRIDVEGKSRVLTEGEWLTMHDNMKDAGYTRSTQHTVSLFRAILQNIVCLRYADRDAAYRAIDEAFQTDRIDQFESRKLESAVEWVICE